MFHLTRKPPIHGNVKLNSAPGITRGVAAANILLETPQQIPEISPALAWDLYFGVERSQRSRDVVNAEFQQDIRAPGRLSDFRFGGDEKPLLVVARGYSNVCSHRYYVKGTDYTVKVG